MSLERRQASVERAKPGDPPGDRRPSRAQDGRQLGGCVRAVPGLAPAGDAGGVGHGDVEASKIEHETNPFAIDRAVVAIATLGPRGTWQHPAPLVEAQRVGTHPQVAGELADAHGATFARGAAEVNPQSWAVAGRSSEKPAARS